jgi:hypothetical protein
LQITSILAVFLGKDMQFSALWVFAYFMTLPELCAHLLGRAFTLSRIRTPRRVEVGLLGLLHARGGRTALCGLPLDFWIVDVVEEDFVAEEVLDLFNMLLDTD